MPVIDRVFPVHAKPCSKIYIEFPFEPKAVRKIVIGPSKDQDGIYKQVENCLKNIDAYSHVKIAKSTIPVVMHKA